MNLPSIFRQILASLSSIFLDSCKHAQPLDIHTQTLPPPSLVLLPPLLRAHRRSLLLRRDQRRSRLAPLLRAILLAAAAPTLPTVNSHMAGHIACSESTPPPRAPRAPPSPLPFETGARTSCAPWPRAAPPSTSHLVPPRCCRPPPPLLRLPCAGAYTIHHQRRRERRPDKKNIQHLVQTISTFCSINFNV